MRVLVIGAGVAGLASAWFLRAAGAEVTVVERAAGPGRETSSSNGSLLHPSLADPWNTPGILGFMLRNLGRQSSPMLLRPRALPSLIGWGLRFVRESTPERHFANTTHNIRLGNFSLDTMRDLRELGVISYFPYQRGTLVVHRTTAALDASARWFDRLNAHKIEHRLLDRDAVLRLEPALTPIGAELVGGVHATRDEGGDPRAFCESLSAALIARGVEIRYGTEVVDWLGDRRRISGIIDAHGTHFPADRVLVAAASYSTLLVRKLGLRLPIRPAKGYSLTLERGQSGTAPFTPVMDPALHMAVVPVGEDRIRVAGTAEFAGYDTSLRATRIANLTGLLQRLYPHFASQIDPARVIPWVGLRGMSADGVPLIGATAIKGLYLNAGHGPVGWTLAAGSGRLIADQMLDSIPAIDPAPYQPLRFS